MLLPVLPVLVVLCSLTVPLFVFVGSARAPVLVRVLSPVCAPGQLFSVAVLKKDGLCLTVCASFLSLVPVCALALALVLVLALQ